MDTTELRNRFQYHPAVTDERKKDHEMVRSNLMEIAAWLNVMLPEGREKALAITKLEEAMFWANAAVARQ
jgi:hypothetical protein